jgi:3D (Asp-Asp-Asp) domain-containing protein
MGKTKLIYIYIKNKRSSIVRKEKKMSKVIRMILAVLLVTLSCLGAAALLGYLCQKYFSGSDMTLGFLSELDKTLTVDIPVHYEFSLKEGLLVRKISDVQLTGYTNVHKETDSTPNHTATGRMVHEGMCAVSQDLFRKEIQPGDVIYVTKLERFFIVDDTMNARHKKAVDIFFYKSHKEKSDALNITRSNIYVIKTVY